MAVIYHAIDQHYHSLFYIFIPLLLMGSALLAKMILFGNDKRQRYTSSKYSCTIKQFSCLPVLALIFSRLWLTCNMKVIPIVTTTLYFEVGSSFIIFLMVVRGFMIGLLVEIAIDGWFMILRSDLELMV